LFETTNLDTIRTGLYGGVTEGWWNSIKDEEKCTPLLSVDSWSEILQDSGFTGLDLVLQDSEDPEPGEQTVLVASAAASTSTDSPLVDRDARDIAVATTILCDDRVAKQKELADLLQNQLGRDARFACSRMDIQSLAPADLSDMSCISLLDIDRPFLARLQEEDFTRLKHIIASSRDILWVSQDSTVPASPEFSMVDGLARVMRGEYPLLKFVTLSLEAEPGLLETPAIILDTWKRMLQTGDSQTELEVRQRAGVLEVPRVIHSPSMNSLVAERSKDRHIVENSRLGGAPPLKLQIDFPGMLDSACYHEIDVDTVLGPLAEDEVLVRAHAFGFSPRDYLIASGRLNEQDIGMQCAGVVEAAGLASGLQPGDRVCALQRPAFCTLVRCKMGSVARIPDSMSYEDAASLPAAAVLAVHTLTAMGSLEEGETVLIQNAASTIGQVLVQVAKSIKACVLVTVKGAEQRKMLSEVYSIPDEHIFAKGGTRVLDATDGQGVDVVVALSPSHDETEAFWKCLSSVGRFFHVGDDRDINRVDSQQGSNVSFFRINLAELVSKRPSYIAKLLRKVATMLQSRTIHPVTGIQTFPAESAKAALEIFAGGDETGASVVLLRAESLVKVSLMTSVLNPIDTAVPYRLTLEKQTELVNRPLYSFDSNGTYVIAGGLGGIGRSIARWMVARGARHLMLLSRSGASRPTAQALVAELAQQNVQVVTPACDIADLDQLKQVIQEASRTMPPFRGCIQGAMNLRVGDMLSHPVRDNQVGF
jgi:NADPH:quinone reductase-like Zn-dependent oxidoreductase